MDDDPNEIVARLIDGWCERRALGLLRSILGPWPHNGLTDGVEHLLHALKAIRNRDDLLDDEKADVNQAIGIYSRWLNAR
ncbi:MAG: hypothetical protein AAF711_00810 [Planctomycetota bacterium]